MERIDRSANGHNMTITPRYSFLGTFKELSFVCHTCDPGGVQHRAFPIVEGNADAALEQAMAFGDQHLTQPI